MKTLRVRPVLVPQAKAIWPNCIWLGRISRQLRLDTSYNDDPKSIDPIDDSMLPQELVLISLEDDKIEDTEPVYYFASKEIVAYPVGGFPQKHCAKIIATQSQLSPEYIQQFVKEYNEGGVKDVEVEMRESILLHGNIPSIHSKTIPKLTNGFITIINKSIENKEIGKSLEDYIRSKHTQEECIGFIDGYNARRNEESILYTQEQVDEMLDRQAAITANQLLLKFKNYYSEEEVKVILNVFARDLSYQVFTNKVAFQSDFIRFTREWFEANKKK